MPYDSNKGRQAATGAADEYAPEDLATVTWLKKWGRRAFFLTIWIAMALPVLLILEVWD